MTTKKTKKQKKLNIAHIHWAFPPIIGGVETHLVMLLPELVKRGHKVSLLTGSEEVRRLNGKQYSNQKLFAILDVMVEKQVPLYVYYSFNLPREDAKAFRQTLSVAQRMLVSTCNWNSHTRHMECLIPAVSMDQHLL